MSEIMVVGFEPSHIFVKTALISDKGPVPYQCLKVVPLVSAAAFAPAATRSRHSINARAILSPSFLSLVFWGSQLTHLNIMVGASAKG